MIQSITEELSLEKIVGGGQALGVLADGRKAFVWGGLPGETVVATFNKQKKRFVDGVVDRVVQPSPARIQAKDPDSYLSTSPWQIMDFASEQRYKAELVREAYALHNIELPDTIDIYTDNNEYGYRNKIECSFMWDDKTQQLDLAFFKRGSHEKIAISGTAIAHPSLNSLAVQIRDVFRQKPTTMQSLVSLLIRCDQMGNCVFQLFTTNKDAFALTSDEFEALTSSGGELIYVDPVTRATKVLVTYGTTTLTDTILGTSFQYKCDSFFQGNVPLYEQALTDMKQWVGEGPVVDMYSGVGTIGFTVGGDNLTLIESNKSAIDEMKRNRYELGKKATIIEATSEASLEYIVPEATIIVDPPRAGLHEAVVDQLLAKKPSRIIYLSCNPVTQARDIKYLSASYKIIYQRGYNFFPRTPHIEYLVVLDLQ